jgi:hypothetical protein
MSVYKNIKKYYRFSTGLKKFLKETISLRQCEEIIKQRIEKREERFLNIVDKAIYRNAKSPYLKLLNLSGYTFEDIKDLVKRVGIEQTLSRLIKDGVYLTFEEFKGWEKVKRNGKVFDFREKDFDNPFLSSYFSVESGGTSSPGTRTMIDFDFLYQEAVNRAMALDIYGLRHAPCILWFPVLPGNAGVMNIFRQVKIDSPPIKWFSQVDERSIRPSIQDRFGTAFIVYMGRFFGSKMPKPEYIDLKEAHKIAEYLTSVVGNYLKCSVWTYVNSAVRICVAARERNLSLRGVTFFVSGEPVTRTKLNEIKSAGADAIPYYAFVEGGITAYGCANPDSPDDMHVLKDRIAVIVHKMKLKHSNDTIDALLFSSLLPESPKILLNVDTGDHGVMRSRRCGCGFEDIGFSDHISGIKSFEKLTSEGMTFMIDDLIHIAENVLPVKYGGSSTDYQVLEDANGDGMSFINIAVSPRIGPVNESDLIKTVIQELGKGKDSRRLMAEVWSKAGTIRVKRMDPVPTKRGKIFSFHSVEN